MGTALAHAILSEEDEVIQGLVPDGLLKPLRVRIAIRNLPETYGSLGRWEEIFRATGASLGGGCGWTVLDWNLHADALRTYWSGNHTQPLAFSAPLLVLEMYENAYQMDYGAAAAKYIDAFMQNVDWQEVDRRFERTAKLGALFAPPAR